MTGPAPFMRASLTAAVACLVSCTALAPPGGETVTIAVHGRGGWQPSQELVLLIGDQTFRGFGGLATAVVAGPVDVYVIERHTCRSRIGFRAEPGSRHLILLGTSDVEARALGADELTDAGPLLAPVPPLDCPEAGLTGAGEAQAGWFPAAMTTEAN